ncbi:unnamed protein product [Withania somnifera]
MPRVHGLALKTTVAAVRVNALLCLGDMVPTLDKPSVLDILQTIQRCTAVDRSAPTLMCTLGVGNSILKKNGIEFVAEHVLPLLMPLLIAQQLNVQQFAKYMAFVKEILRKIEEKRGVTLSDSGNPAVNVKSSLSVDSQMPGQVNKTSASRSLSWDEDWIPPRGPSTSVQSSMTLPAQSATSGQSIQVTSGPSQLYMASGVSSQQLLSSCPAVDVEWPPRPSSLGTTILGDSEKQPEKMGELGSSLDEIDPFANWPPRPSGSSLASHSVNNGTMAPFTSRPVSNSSATLLNGLNSQTHVLDSWAFSTQISSQPLKPNQGITSHGASLSSGGLDPQSSLGFMKHCQGLSSALSASSGRATDIGSIFSSNKVEQTAPRLAPPPSTSVGRGRGRGRENQVQLRSSTLGSGNIKSHPEKPSLPDLL